MKSIKMIIEDMLFVLVIAFSVSIIYLRFINKTNSYNNSYSYRTSDVLLTIEYIKGNISLDEKTISIYDINKDDEIDVIDVVLMNNIIKENCNER